MYVVSDRVVNCSGQKDPMAGCISKVGHAHATCCSSSVTGTFICSLCLELDGNG